MFSSTRANDPAPYLQSLPNLPCTRRRQPRTPNVAMNSSFTTTPETTTIVRSYSLKVGKENPSNVLSQALGSATKHDEEGDLRARVTAEEWHRWLYGPSPTSDASIFSPLEREREELIRVWQEFQRIFVNPGADNISALDSHRIPTIATLQAAVEDAHTNWEVKHQSGFGRAKTRFREFIETMNDHSYLFKFVPAQDKYLSLLTGVVATVVKTSLNYQKIAEGFSLALVEMSANLRYVEKKTHIANTAEMQRLVVELYVKIFKFLCHAMSFFHKRRKRFFASFDKTFYDRSVQAMVDDIQKTIKRIKDEAQHTSELRIEEINSKVDWLVRLQELGTHSHGNSQQEIDDKNATAAIGFKRLGETAVRHLGLVEEQVRLSIISQQQSNTTSSTLYLQDISQRTTTNTELSIESVEVEEVTGSTGSSTGSSKVTVIEPLTRYEMHQYSHNLDPYIEDGADDIIHRALIHGRDPVIPQEVFVEFSKWVGGARPPIMWIEGPAVSSSGSVLSQAAIEAVNTIANAGTPCISVFCKSRYNFATRGLGHTDAAVISLYYSVIRQLAQIVPPEFEGSPGLQKHCFERLDGSLESLGTALAIIKALLKHAPPSIAWVIDGLQFAGGSQDGYAHIQDFIQVLRDQEQERTSRVCFTTDGRSQVLDRGITVRERVDASRLVQARGGRAFPGAVYI